MCVNTHLRCTKGCQVVGCKAGPPTHMTSTPREARKSAWAATPYTIVLSVFCACDGGHHASRPRSASQAEEIARSGAEVTETPDVLMDNSVAPRTCRCCKAAFRGGAAVWAYCTTCDEPVCSHPCHLSHENECAWPTDSSSSRCCRSRSGSSSDNCERGTDQRGNSLPPVCGHRPRGDILTLMPQGPCLAAGRGAGIWV